jgi:acyl-CoA dehydrogenase
MISWELTPEQKTLRDTVHRFAEKQIRPLAQQMDETCETDEGLLEKAKEMGLPGCTVPREYGGGGLDVVSSAIIGEELAWGCAAFAVTITEDWISCLPLLDVGTEEQKKKWLPRVAEEGKLIGSAITEPGAGSDVSTLSTTARKDGNLYTLNGAKQFITNGGIADFYNVFATLDKSKGYKGITAFLVDSQTPGFYPGKKERKMGLSSSHTGELIFENVCVPEENLLGVERGGFRVAMKLLDYSRVIIASVAVGLARAAMEEAAKYAQERVQFGKPIGVNQGVSFKLADMAIRIQAARHLMWHAAWLADQGKSYSHEAAMAKCFASDVAMWVTTEAIQVFGGAGYMKDFQLEKWMRDAKILQIVVGTNEIQRMLISRVMMPDLGKI